MTHNVGLIRKFLVMPRRRPPGKGAWLCAAVAGSLGAVGATVVHPILLVAGLVATTALLAVPIKRHKLFWPCLLVLLAGYLFLGKGFAYLGVAPVYVAEIGLALAAATALSTLLMNRLQTIAPFFRLEIVLLLAFVAWQVLCTVPYLEEYGVYAIRDGALWGYAAFAFFILLLVPWRSVDAFFVVYGRVLPFYLAWLLVAWVFVKVSPLEVYIPGSSVPVLLLKSGDVGVHLAGAAAFMLLRLDLRGKYEWTNAKLWFLWTLWVANWLAWGVSNRAGMFSALVGIGIVLLLRQKIQWHRPLVVALSLLLLLFITDFSSPAFGDQYNQVPISSEQIISNVTSTFGEESASSLGATREFRLNWWGDIVSYTLGGEHFWTGKGYGINLANDDGYQVHQETEDLRNPHNVFMTILARSGVPGLVLWLLFLLSFGATLVRRASSPESGNPWSARYALWSLAYLLAFLFNASFDVFLEGPMGAVWFWSLVGISLVYFTRAPRPPGSSKHM